METTLISSVITFGLTQLVKFIPQIPVNTGQTARIRSVVGFLSLICTLGTLWASGTLQEASTLKIATDAIVSYLASAGIYEHSPSTT